MELLGSSPTRGSLKARRRGGCERFTTRPQWQSPSREVQLALSSQCSPLGSFSILTCHRPSIPPQGLVLPRRPWYLPEPPSPGLRLAGTRGTVLVNYPLVLAL
ncbi:hypothetical protein KIN20_016177 [Parelaphostrongylus tenuis]|uniref:Uncharacterized protein n=1 Tax=Parelaphostrongylus tenuis TaxID=148309 RepID=A0AAD5QQJ1_PARTN|nr:hypothetical protein KIN20_016177 [Parelaphostrongylus tenuis]